MPRPQVSLGSLPLRWETLFIAVFAMTRLQQLPVALQHSLKQRSTLKVIAGLMNFDAASVERVARAAGRGGADLRWPAVRSGAAGRVPWKSAGGVSSVERAVPCWPLAR